MGGGGTPQAQAMIPSFVREWFLAVYYFFMSFFAASLQVTFPKSQISVKVIRVNQESIGEGAFSSVYYAVNQSDSTKHYALKRMLLQSLDLANMARNEVDSYQRFRHPNIIQLIDHVEKVEGSRAVVYMLMPYCSRGSLRNELNEMLADPRRRPPINHVLQRFADICRACQVLHDFVPSFVHFDLKPEVTLRETIVWEETTFISPPSRSLGD